MKLYVAAAGFKLEGGEWLDSVSHKTLDEMVLEYKETHTHSYADRPLEGEALEEHEIDDAMMNPTPDKVMRLARKLGPMRFEKIITDYDFDTARMRMRPGATRPVYAADGKTVVQKKAGEKNPWSAKGWNITRQGEIVKSLGIAKAAALARAAGCNVGDIKPNPHYN